MQDQISIDRLNKLHPKVRDTFRAFITECENTFHTTLRIIQGMRTIAEQNALYAQGRTTPGAKVTNAKGGTSFHNYGLAVDLAEIDVNDIDHDGNTKEINWNFDMGKLDAIAKRYGLEWGGNWHTIVDKPHFQLTYGYTWQQLLAIVNNHQVDAQGYVLI